MQTIPELETLLQNLAQSPSLSTTERADYMSELIKSFGKTSTDTNTIITGAGKAFEFLQNRDKSTYSTFAKIVDILSSVERHYTPEWTEIIAERIFPYIHERKLTMRNLTTIVNKGIVRLSTIPIAFEAISQKKGTLDDVIDLVSAFYPRIGHWFEQDSRNSASAISLLMSLEYDYPINRITDLVESYMHTARYGNESRRMEAIEDSLKTATGKDRSNSYLLVIAGNELYAWHPELVNPFKCFTYNGQAIDITSKGKTAITVHKTGSKSWYCQGSRSFQSFPLEGNFEIICFGILNRELYFGTEQGEVKSAPPMVEVYKRHFLKTPILALEGHEEKLYHATQTKVYETRTKKVIFRGKGITDLHSHNGVLYVATQDGVYNALNGTQTSFSKAERIMYYNGEIYFAQGNSITNDSNDKVISLPNPVISMATTDDYHARRIHLNKILQEGLK